MHCKKPNKIFYDIIFPESRNVLHFHIIQHYRNGSGPSKEIFFSALQYKWSIFSCLNSILIQFN